MATGRGTSRWLTSTGTVPWTTETFLESSLELELTIGTEVRAPAVVHDADDCAEEGGSRLVVPLVCSALGARKDPLPNVPTGPVVFDPTFYRRSVVERRVNPSLFQQKEEDLHRVFISILVLSSFVFQGVEELIIAPHLHLKRGTPNSGV